MVSAAGGTFTLITGILAGEPIPTGTAAFLANGAVEAFVRADAIEIAPQRINAVSPNVFPESPDAYGDFFPGMGSVPVADVARAYVRSVEGNRTGQVYAVKEKQWGPWGSGPGVLPVRAALRGRAASVHPAGARRRAWWCAAVHAGGATSRPCERSRRPRCPTRYPCPRAAVRR
ncbi:hypothetical protein [Streptomyces noursei]|uniref:hypothetical protein n=1 Tax=Streptomyces noursei TaxID=1971 RepID=UPI003BF4A20A